MADLTGMMQAAAGAAGGENLYIEDVFSTYLYTGTGAAQTITNGIDLDGEGGLVWIKSRSAATGNFLFDTNRGTTDEINSDTTDAEASLANSLTAFSSAGFSVSSATGIGVSAATYVSWTFRKAEKFFDVVTYTGNGANRTISHNLGSVPGCIMVKRTDNTGDWQVYHRANTANPETDYLVLNSTAATADSDTRWNDTLPTDSVFSLGTEATVNANGGTYVAYLWAHDAGGFGDDGSENVITCGSFTTDVSGNFTVTLGYEPQWIMLKANGEASNWFLGDIMRGMSLTSGEQLRANTDSASFASLPYFPTATGFRALGLSSSATYIYIAIRRGPMKTPTAGTEVFSPFYKASASFPTTFDAGFPADIVYHGRLSTAVQGINCRLTTLSLFTYAAANESSVGTITINYGYNQNEWLMQSDYGGAGNQLYYSFRRAPKCIDVVCYTGTGANRTLNHNLGVVPELMIVKNRVDSRAWAVYAGNNTDYLVLNSTAATAVSSTYWNDTSPTSTVFSVGTDNSTNESGDAFVAYLFASLAGVSKVGTYTGNGSSVTVTTGFQPRFILVKRTDSTGNWIVGNSARGLVAGNDPFLLWNSTNTEVTNEDWVDITSTSFTVNETAANANVNTGTYLYLAIS